MMELIIYGRGGQGGVTLAKLIAEAYFLRGLYAQAFGVYAAERSGAPVQAFVRVDREEIANHNEIREPDHVIVLDRTLIGPRVLVGLKAGGWIVLNTPHSPSSYASMFPGRRVATIDATAIAVAHGLGTRAVPIVNSTLLGAIGQVLEFTNEEVEAALSALHFAGANVESCRRAYCEVDTALLPGDLTLASPALISSQPTSILGANVGAPPLLRTGGWATRRPERRRLEPPCNQACPAGNDVQAFVSALAENDVDKALDILLETSPLPGTCGRVCPAPCMDACNRGLFDESVNVRELERYVAERGQPRRSRVALREEQVAVVGSGPAGLSASYQLARLGYDVALFEGEDELGGVLRTGIPAYRLPRSVLDQEIEFVLSHGVDVRRRHHVSRSELLEMSRQYAAIFLATGLQRARSLESVIETSVSRERIEQGIDFLDRARKGSVDLSGEQIVVVGGGNTAIDAARTARRLGAGRVRILYRRSREQMPAIADEVNAAIEEGVVLHELVSPSYIRETGGALLMTCQRMCLGAADESGRAMAVPETTEDSFYDIRCDRIILALGQTSDVSILPEGAEIRENGVLLGLTGAPVFCGGDLATQEGTVAAAIGNGRMAALHIHRTLSGEDLIPRPSNPPADPTIMTMHVFTRSPRKRGSTIDVRLRRSSFEEVHRGFPEDDGNGLAADEARRCFSCGVCNSCDRCRQFCPEGIVRRDELGYRFDYDYCKGCGVCAAQCPRGVIYMTDL